MDGFAKDTELIRRLVEYSGLKPAAVAKVAGVAVTTINRPYTGTSSSRLGRSVLEKLQAAFPDFPGWADLPVVSTTPDDIPFKNAVLIEAAEDALGDPDLVEIDEIDLRFGLGGTFLDNPVETEKRVFSRSWLRHFTNAPPHLLTWTIGEGDSMEPTIRSGEIILIDRSQTSPVMGDGIWAIAFGEVGMIKRLRPRPDGTVDIHSDNPVVRPDRATDGELYIVGRVVAVVRRL